MVSLIGRQILGKAGKLQLTVNANCSFVAVWFLFFADGVRLSARTICVFQFAEDEIHAGYDHFASLGL